MSADTEESISINHWEIMTRFREKGEEIKEEKDERTKDGRFYCNALGEGSYDGVLLHGQISPKRDG